MTWVRIDDGAPLHPKLLDAGVEAAWLWACGLAYCNRNHTDGLIASRHLAALYPGAWSADRLLDLAARLVVVRLWDADGGDYRVHDYDHYQEEATREVVDARRVYERDRKRAQRLKSRPGHVPDNVPGTIAGHVPGTNTGTPPGTEGGTAPADMPPADDSRPTQAQVVPAPRPVPSRPDPVPEIQNSDLVDSGVPPSPTRIESRDERRDRLSLERREADEAKARDRAKRDADRAAKAEAKRVADEAKAAEKVERERLAAEAEAKRVPLPFKPIVACRAVAAKADGRFTEPEPRDITTGYAIALNASIRSYPTLEEWERLGSWLASPDCTYPGRLAVAWAASSALRDGMSRARAWSAMGPLALAGNGAARFGREPPVAAIPPPPLTLPGALAVDRPVMPQAEAKVHVGGLMAKYRAGIPIDGKGVGNG